tara:strand:- start:517 stop:999 length:483 start_codon:yes stop_codon:yes gene_type:complete
MIQATTSSNLTVYLQTEDNRINTSVTTSQIRFLVKFTNDMDKSKLYVYGQAQTIYDRYTKMTFYNEANNNVYTGRLELLPAGYWKYEVYEVSWLGDPTLEEETAPVTETQVIEPASPDVGVVQGLVTKGKMYVAEKDGTQQVQYTQHPEPSGTNYIYYGQ